MKAKQIESFEAVAGELLEDLGYPRAVPHPGSAALLHSRRMREAFAQDARTRS
jgi:hypothetical protein